MPKFESARKKIERANKYLAEIELATRKFAASDFYTMRIEHKSKMNYLCVDVDKSRFPFDDTALAIGDALHNLRTALDHLWFETIFLCSGKEEDWTIFPIKDSVDKVEAAMAQALKKKHISLKISRLMLMTIKPYPAGNTSLWALHFLNNIDKHKMLVPGLELMQISDVRLEDDKGCRVGQSKYILDDSFSARLPEAYAGKVTVKDKGHASATVLFSEGTDLWGKPVVPSLHWITEEVMRTLKAFEIVLGK